MTFSKTPKLLVLAAAALLCASCASNNSGDLYDSGFLIQDPYESMNRKVFAFNVAADKHVIHPVVTGYRTIAPKPVRSGLTNVLRNLRSPIDLANQILQWDLPGVHDVLVRTAVNSTLGLGGVIDLAGHEGIEYEFEDFGQTLAVWGIDHGPYFVLPLLGPSSMRDYSGYAVDSISNPLRFYLTNTNQDDLLIAQSAAGFLTLADSVKDAQIDLQNSSIDYYAALRSIYYQRRAALINDSDLILDEIVIDIPDYDDDF